MATKDSGGTIDFIGIGAMKSATTWIYDCLAEHPEICRPIEQGADGRQTPIKEVHFFDSHYEKGIEYYEALFSHCEPGQLKGEFTPRYLYYENVAERIYGHYPDVKLIVCLRNPMERAQSQYHDYIELGGRDFREALDLYPELIERGLYYKQLQRYLEFFPRDRFLFLLYDDIRKDRRTFLRQVFRYLDIDDDFVPEHLTGRSNVSREVRYRLWPVEVFRRKARAVARRASPGGALRGVLRTAGGGLLDRAIRRLNSVVTRNPARSAEMDKETRTMLREIFQKDIQALEGLLDRDLGDWV